MKKYFVSSMLLAAVATSSFAQTAKKPAATSQPKTATTNQGGVKTKPLTAETLKKVENKNSYAIGLALAKQMQMQVGQITNDDKSLDLGIIYAAFNEYNNSGKMRLDSVELSKTLTDWQQGMQAKKNAVSQQAASENKQKGAAYIAQQMASNPKLKKTASGLVYEVLTEGSGTKPTPENQVKVNYKGTLIDGTVFDESKSPIEFGLGQVIKGWTEGLQLMTPGSKYRFIIPSDLAYGDQDRSAQIKAGSTLVFEVELLEVK